MSEHGILDVPWHLYDQLGNEFGDGEQKIQRMKKGEIFFIQSLDSVRVGFAGVVTFEHWTDSMRRRRRFCLLPAVPKNRSERRDFLLEVESFESSQNEHCCVARPRSSGLNLGFPGTPFVTMVFSEAQRLYTTVATDYEAALFAD